MVAASETLRPVELEGQGITLAPPLKWAGGKRWLVPLLRSIWPAHSHRRLVEPFCGGLAVTLGLGPSRAQLNDINPHVLNFYRWIKKGLELSIALENSPECYYAHRQSFNDLIAQDRTDTALAAELFYYLNRTGYNGLCRFNSSGFFNVPFGKYATISYLRDFRAYGEPFGDYEFSCGDFSALAVNSEDFLYVDPPYDVPFTAYSKESFKWDDQVRLIEWLVRHQGPVVLSNQATERVVALYRSAGFSLEFLSAPRRISCTGDRSPAQEVLAFRGL